VSGETITVQYASADGSAVAAGDYAAVSGSLTFAPGELSKVIEVQVVGDALVEADETLTITLSNATNATIAAGEATGTIVDDDEETEPTSWQIYLPLVVK
jgi:chitinase